MNSGKLMIVLRALAFFAGLLFFGVASGFVFGFGFWTAAEVFYAF